MLLTISYKFWKIALSHACFRLLQRDSLSNAALFHAFQPRYDLYTSVTQRAVTILDVESASGWELRRTTRGDSVLSLSLSLLRSRSRMEEASRMMYDSEKNRRELITIIHKRRAGTFYLHPDAVQIRMGRETRRMFPIDDIPREYRDARDKRVFNVEQGGRPVEKAQLDIASARN